MREGLLRAGSLTTSRSRRRDDRKLADVVYVIVRRFMYGDVNGSQPPAEVPEQD
jgi:hypothetical protein